MDKSPRLRDLLADVTACHNDLRKPGVAVALFWELVEAVIIWLFWRRLVDDQHD